MISRSKTVIVAVVGLTVLYCVFVLLFEIYAARQANLAIHKHAAIVADDLWNFNHIGAREYLKPAADNSHYHKISIISHNGEVFEEITTALPNELERAGLKLSLVSQVTLIAPVEYESYFLGWVEAVWIPQTLFTNVVVLAFMVMALLIILLYTKIVEEKGLLEQHVIQRTSELTSSNINLQREVKERTAAEAALQSSETKYRHLTESIDDVIWVMSPDLLCTYMSPVCSKLFEWQPDQLHQTNLEIIFSPVSFPVFKEAVDHAFMGGPMDHTHLEQGIELEMTNRKNGRIWCEIKFSCLMQPTDGVLQVMCVARDVTQRKAEQYEKEMLQEQLEHSKKMESLGLLAGGVAHDLNNVLSGIVSYPELILLDLPSKSPLRKRIETIRDSGVKAAEIVQDLLALARRGVVSVMTVNINKLVTEYQASPEYDALLSNHPEISISFSLDAHLPYITGSEIHLKKVIMNLVTNAAEATHINPNREVHLVTKNISLTVPINGHQAIPPGHYVVLSVEDNGEGIDPNDLKRVFEPFFTKKVMGRSGTGLGLTVVWGVVEDHNGFLNITSEKNKGTTIELYFPAADEQTLVSEKITASAHHQGNGERILVVDDVQQQREILSKILNRLNYQVDAVESGKAALDNVAIASYDLVILDMIMTNGMDGLDTFKQLRKLDARLKVIIASGYAATDRVKEAQRLGAGDYVQKPYSIEEISLAVRKALRG